MKLVRYESQGGGMKPPLFLKAGDIVSLGIDGLGEQCQHVVQR